MSHTAPLNPARPGDGDGSDEKCIPELRNNKAPSFLPFPSMTSSLRREVDEEGRLDESYVQDAFHSYLKSSLAQAKVERLLDVEVLSSAEGDLMITGPSKPPSAFECPD